MRQESFIATAWKSGKWDNPGIAYGLKVPIKDRDRFFKKDWKTATLRLVAGKKRRVAEANVAKNSFWDKTCRELIKKEIGLWFIDCGFAPWPDGDPPRFRIFPADEREFEVEPSIPSS